MIETVSSVQPARTRASRVHDVEIGGAHVTLTIGELPDGRPGEVFLHGGKQGSTFAGLCDTVGISVSLALQHHTPVAEIAQRLANHRYEPAGATTDPEIPQVTSVSDYLARRLARDYLSAADRRELGM